MFSIISTFKYLTTTRAFWFAVFISSCIAFAFALVMQYVYGLPPCNYCVYSRFYLLGVILSAFIGIIHPKNFTFRLVSIALFIYSAVKGMENSGLHLNYVNDTSPLKQCSIPGAFPFKLNETLPSVFKVQGTCSPDTSYTFLSLTFVEWTFYLFVLLTAFATLVFLVQPFRTKIAKR